MQRDRWADKNVCVAIYLGTCFTRFWELRWGGLIWIKIGLDFNFFLVVVYVRFCKIKISFSEQLHSMLYIFSRFPIVNSNSFKWSSGILILLNHRNAFLNVMKLRKIPLTAHDYRSFTDNSAWEICHWVLCNSHFLIPIVKAVLSLQSFEQLLCMKILIWCFMSIFFPCVSL